MIVDGVARTGTAQCWELSATIRSSSPLGGERVHFIVEGGQRSWLSERGDAFLAALLMPAMALGEDLVIAAPVSRRLVRSARTVMDIYAAWWPELHPVRIRTIDTGRINEEGAAGVGLFFTTGVDSFYSLLKDVECDHDPSHEPVTHLIFTNFERHQGQDYERLLAQVGHVAEQTGRRRLVVDTNIQSLFNSVVSWPAYHGAALAAVALALQGLLGRCLIAASDEYRHLPPLGSHPILDPLWSTECLEIIHDGAEATRTDKIERQLAGSRLALESLGVCWISKPAQNCGVCDKCLRTMIALELSGVLGTCMTLPATLDLNQLRSVPMWSEDSRDAMRSMVADARRRGRHDIADAAEEGLGHYQSPGNNSTLGGPMI